MRRYVAGLFVLPLLVLTAACGDDSSGNGTDTEQSASSREGTISDVTVTGDAPDEPKIEFKAPITFSKTESKVINEGAGTGPEAVANSVVTVNYLGVNASTGEDFDSSWSDDGKATPATFGLGQVIPGFSSGLIGTQAGDRVLLTINSKDGYDPTGSTDGTIKKGDSLVFVVDVLKVQNPVTLSESQVPTVVEKKGKPSGFVTKPTVPKTVDDLGVYVVKEGTGAPVEAGQTITVNYLGAIYPDGKVFDESFSKQPATFSIGTGQVIAGWDQALVGQKVGSRLIVVIPSELGYGTAGQGKDIPPNSDLIFLIDIQKAE